ncbi:long-chain fatty acid transporter [Phenylobacterium hankyongense]|uniref:Long-chain fatty acid transporter n=2 Tax=Phenylobacterium hankyongense TaxID=1813876 RepID=A0A328AZU6_9CAUL|nr:outer membrane protein transport protein [Phenylobacterium hankyongense]RAK60453.1 long-chain fatty acid transporter [Phenylobacterium hankyongense]
MNRTLALALASAAAVTAATQAHAGGFYLQEQSVRGTGRAYSGEVADQGVESLWWNPAAIARSPREVYVGAHGIIVDGKTTNTGSTVTYPGGTTVPVGGQSRAYNPIEAGLAPNFAIATPIGDRFAVGLSVAAPYNFTTKYDPRAWTRYDALTTKLNTADIQLTGAMKVNDWLDLGVSADAQYTRARLGSAYPNLSPLLPDARSQLKGDGWNYGWSAGAQAHFDRLTLGASYRSAMDHDLSGDVLVTGLLGPLAAANLAGSGSASFTTPWIATVGGRYRLTDKLTVDAQAQRIGWSQFDAIQVTTPAGPQTLAQNYKDTTSGGVGADYAVTDRLTLRAGVQYDPTPTPDAERTARVPDGDRWLYAVGATAHVTDRMQLEAAVAYIDFQNSDVNHDTTFYAGTPAATTTALRGQVEGAGYVLSMGLRASF